MNFIINAVSTLPLDNHPIPGTVEHTLDVEFESGQSFQLHVRHHQVNGNVFPNQHEIDSIGLSQPHRTQFVHKLKNIVRDL
jgi:hypothetical protein